VVVLGILSFSAGVRIGCGGQQGGCQASGIHLMLRNIRQTVGFAETLRALMFTEFCHEADTANRQCQSMSLEPTATTRSSTT
jgi:hypothetical protein